MWLSGSQIPHIQACGLARATAEAVGIPPGPGIDPRVRPVIDPGINPRVGPGVDPWIGPEIDLGRAEGRKEDCCGSVIYPRGYLLRDTVDF